MANYQEELRMVIKVWMFSFNCASCILSERLPLLVQVIPPTQEEKEEGLYFQPPSLICDCGDVLYNISSKDFYDLLLSLFESTSSIITVYRNENLLLEDDLED